MPDCVGVGRALSCGTMRPTLTWIGWGWCDCQCEAPSLYPTPPSSGGTRCAASVRCRVCGQRRCIVRPAAGGRPARGGAAAGVARRATGARGGLPRGRPPASAGGAHPAGPAAGGRRRRDEG
eukprot:365056-Chlamydomonas_euryale.AAC.1